MHIRQGLPEEMQILLRDYPRESWPGHPNFAASIQNWMGAHVMFRRLSAQSERQVEAYLEGDLDADGFAERFGYFGDLLLRNLHGHHTWEDRKFFPELSAADDRFDHGLAMLEADHIEMDGLLDAFSRQGNRAVMLAHMDPDQAYEEAGKLLPQVGAIRGFLQRHLTDEEELVVPILLHHKMRG